MQKSRSFSTPLAKLDQALGEHLSAGQFILCAGLTGNGKTILAGQLAAHFALAEVNVLYVSTEVDHAELFKRTMAACSSIRYDLIKDGIKLVPIDFSPELQLQVPDSGTFGMEAASKASVVCLALAKHETFVAIESLGDDPRRELDVVIERYKAEKNYLPDVIVYDYLDYPKVRTKEEINPFRMQKAVVDAAIALKSTPRSPSWRHAAVLNAVEVMVAN